MAYDLVAEADSGRRFLQAFILWPQQWRRCAALRGVTWRRIKYVPSEIRTLPNAPGIYAFVVSPSVAGAPDFNYLLYIGKAERQTLRQRCSQYRYEPRKRKPRVHIVRMLKNWRSHLHLYYAPVRGNVTAVEDRLLEAFIPPCNPDLPAELAAIGRLIYHA
jgi:hypothetical protein